MSFFNDVADGFIQLGDIMKDGFEDLGDSLSDAIDRHNNFVNNNYSEFDEEQWEDEISECNGVEGFNSRQKAEYEAFLARKAAREQEEEDRRLEPIREAERAQRRERFANMSEELEDLFARFCAYNNGELDDAAKKQLLEDAAVFDGGCEAAIAHYSQKYDYDISQAGGSMELMKIMQHMDSIAKHYAQLKGELVS